jgi:hypothetical protein
MHISIYEAAIFITSYFDLNLILTLFLLRGCEVSV